MTSRNNAPNYGNPATKGGKIPDCGVQNCPSLHPLSDSNRARPEGTLLEARDWSETSASARPRSAWVRSAATSAVAFLGVELEPRLNHEGKGDGLLSDPAAPVPVVLIEVREDVEIASQVRAALA